MEIIVELFKTVKHLLHVASWVHQVCDSEMVRACCLSESRAWHCHNASLVHHLEAVDKVGLLALLFGLLDELV